MRSRGKKLALNTITSLVLQVVSVICGFILPRLILESFGSDVNGLVNSITQFLGVITLLDLGVGAVVQSALYKPLISSGVRLAFPIGNTAGLCSIAYDILSDACQ